MLNTIRNSLPASSRDQVYIWVAAAVTLLAGLGYVTNTAAALWSAAGISSVTLAYALVHATSSWRAALYGFIIAAAPLATWYSIGTEEGWAAVVVFAAAVLGLTKATSTSQTFDESVGLHRAE